MAGAPTQWLNDGAGRINFAAAYDFTSAEFHGSLVGVAFAVTESPEDAQDGGKRVQVTLPPHLALALAKALVAHATRLQPELLASPGLKFLGHGA